MNRELVFVDTETTGLDPHSERLVELSWALSEGPIYTLYFGVTSVNDYIDNLIKFTERGISGKTSSNEEIGYFLDISKENTMVAAQPSFDKSFLMENSLFEFHYRLLDVESYAMAKLDLPHMPSMRELYQLTQERGLDFQEPMHTSASDVAFMRAVFLWLRAGMPGE